MENLCPLEYGVPVRSPGACSLYAGRDAAGSTCLYGVMGQETESGALFVLRIDPATGACERFDTPRGYTGCRSALWSERWNRLFMYANTSEHVNADNIRRGSGLLVLDPAVNKYLYGATREAVYRVPLGSVEVEVVWRDRANGPSAGGALNNGNYIFASYDRLRALPVVTG